DPLPIPCTTTVSIFRDAAGAQPKTNPFTSDGLGNIIFFAPPGNYVISVVGVNVTPTTYRVTLPCAPSSSCGGGGGGGNPAGNNGDVQTKLTGVTFGAAAINDNVTIPGAVTIDRDVHPKGPNPAFDIMRYGGYLWNILSPQTMSCSINATSTTLVCGSN